MIRGEADPDRAARAGNLEEKRLVPSGGLHRSRQALRVRLLETVVLPEGLPDGLFGGRGALRPELDAEEVAVEDAAPHGEESRRDGTPGEAGDVLRDARLELSAVGGKV